MLATFEMEKNADEFFHADEVRMLFPKSGQVKYGLVLRQIDDDDLYHQDDLPAEFRCEIDPNHLNVVWHPEGNKTKVESDKVR